MDASRRGKSRPSPRPPPRKNKKKFLAILGAFLPLFLHMGAFLQRFSHFWGPFCYFLLHGGVFFWACPLPPTKISAAPMIARRVREHASRKFFCVTAILDMFCYDFALKMTIVINCSQVPARWV